MIVEYCPKGDPVSDFEVNEYVELAIENEHLFPMCKVSTSNAIDTFRLYYMKGKIAELSFEYQGQEIAVDHNGRLAEWPKGFCDLQMIQLSQLARNQVEKDRKK